MSFLENLWGPIEPLVWLIGLSLAIHYFFADRPRRVTVMGYIPTVICLVFDKFEHKVLVAKVREADLWILPQGRVKGDIIASGERVLSNELGLARGFTFFDSKFLGILPMRRSYRLQRYKDPREFRLWPWWRGKAYFGLPIDLPMAAAEAQVVEDHFREVRWVTVPEARQLLKSSHPNGKLNCYLEILADLEQRNFYVDRDE